MNEESASTETYIAAPTDADKTIIEKNFIRNAFAFVGQETTWAIGMPCCFLITMIPAYLHDLNASKTLIQLVTICCTATNVFMFFSSKLFFGPDRKKRLFLFWQLFCAGWFLYGGLAWLGYHPSLRWFWIGLFSLMCLGISIIAAIGTPPFEEMLLQNMPLRRRGLISAFRSLGLGMGGLAGTALALWLFKQWTTPLNYHLRFMIGAVIMAASLLLMFPFRDYASQAGHAERPLSIRADTGKLLNNFNFRILLAFYMLLTTALSLAPLMLTYGKDYLSMGPKGDYFTAAWFIGAMVFGLVVSLLADRFGFKLIGAINAVLLTIAFLCPVIAGHHPVILLIGYTLYGGSCILTFFVLPNLGSEMAPEVRPATILAVGTALALPLGLAVAPLAGVLVDLLGQSGYIGAFMVGTTFSLCAVIGFAFIIREPRTGQELYLRIRRM